MGVILIFTICWLPLQVILLGNSFQIFNFSITKVALQIASHVLAYANSCVNPILYAFFSPAFRRAFQDVLRKKTNKNIRQELKLVGGKVAIEIAVPRSEKQTDSDTAIT